jgi:uncharacterized NAD(P)/FAD-binding protein YdhS
MGTPRAKSFLEIDWKSRARGKEEHWSKIRAEHGAAAASQVADALRRQVQQARPDWPSDEERRHDLETHLRVWDVIRRVGRLGP